ncbi:MAG TPA: EAL domain-containing protein [Jatrophihabitans sp.]|jgi:diguanylate cyclase (GGDEF)-like protein/PAS domain S-box-containing protein|uniref:EAL domain-containing protein n=1 Tax=Jatrophihabitans sp. TaxID=1932789 RepID=UPI002F15F01B
MYAMQTPGPEPIGHKTGGAQLRELLLAGLVDRLPAAIYAAESGANGQWVYASPQIQEMLGFCAEDLIADPGLWARQLHPEDRDWVLRSEMTQPGTGRSQIEYRMIRRDGQVIWVLDDALLDEVGDGAIQHGLLYDITARKRTELLLAEHADIVERVARGDELESTLIELASATETVSGTARCLIEVEAGAGLGRSILTGSDGVFTEADRDRFGPAGHQADFTAPNGNPLGRVSLHYPDLAVAQDRDGDLAGWAASLASVAVLRAAEHARVTLSMSLLEATLDATADGILVIGADGRILGYNQKFVDMWRIEPAVLASGEDARLRASVLDQLVDPDDFTRKADALMATPAECSHDEIEFLDGRFFERYSQPQRIDGLTVGRVWSFRDMTLHRQLEQELRVQAFTDPLTPLANRTYFIQQVTAALSSSRRREGSLAVLLLDLDDFKTVNDSLGHVAGDALLIAVAERLSTCVAPGDVAARLGGDEFVVLLRQLDGAEDAVYAAERVLAALSAPLVVEGQTLTIRASIGIALPSADEDAGDLLRNADLAMYTAKRDGGGRCHCYAPGMHVEAMARLALKADLEHAIETDKLIVHYQPIHDLRSFEIVSMEALVRWQHPERGLISPEEFVALAEESRLIDRLGSAVLRQACNQLAQWRRSIPAQRELTVSVNVSPRQLSDPGLISEVQRALWVAGLPASALVLEITESSLATPTVDVVTVLNQLKDLGVALALDDFGVGYSSLGQLVNFPLDIVKVDKSFVDRLNGELSGAALLRAVLQVAEALSLETTIEGIEDENQLEQVRALGCGRAQGYLLSRPLDIQAASDLLAGRSAPARAVVGRHSIMQG